MHNKRFNPEHKDKLDSEQRRRELPPDQLLNLLPIGDQDDILDAGAGTGYFTLPVARMTGGTVYALDVEAQMLDSLRRKIDDAALTNVEMVQGSISDIPLPSQSVAHIIASHVLHEVEPLSQALSEFKRLLHVKGHVFCLDWEKKETISGPPLDHRIHSSDLADAFEDAGFRVSRLDHPTDSHYLIIAQRA